MGGKEEHPIHTNTMNYQDPGTQRVYDHYLLEIQYLGWDTPDAYAQVLTELAANRAQNATLEQLAILERYRQEMGYRG